MALKGNGLRGVRMFTGDKAYRKAEISRSTAYSHLAKNDLSRPEHPSVPLFALGHQHTRLGNRDACDQNRLGPKHTPRRAIFNASEPHSQPLGGFAGRIGPKRHPASAFPQVGEADSEQPSPTTAQKPRVHGEIGAHFLRNRPEVAGARPRARPRQPSTPTRAQPEASRGTPAGEAAAADVHAGMLISSICACNKTNACTGCTANHRAKALMETPAEPRTRPTNPTPIHPRQPAKKSSIPTK